MERKIERPGEIFPVNIDGISEGFKTTLSTALSLSHQFGRNLSLLPKTVVDLVQQFDYADKHICVDLSAEPIFSSHLFSPDAVTFSVTSYATESSRPKPSKKFIVGSLCSVNSPDHPDDFFVGDRYSDDEVKIGIMVTTGRGQTHGKASLEITYPDCLIEDTWPALYLRSHDMLMVDADSRTAYQRVVFTVDPLAGILQKMARRIDRFNHTDIGGVNYSNDRDVSHGFRLIATIVSMLNLSDTEKAQLRCSYLRGNMQEILEFIDLKTCEPGENHYSALLNSDIQEKELMPCGVWKLQYHSQDQLRARQDDDFSRVRANLLQWSKSGVEFIETLSREELLLRRLHQSVYFD